MSCWDSTLASVKVWRSQLAANDFPPVCAMSGAAAETWRKFDFADSPWWAFFLGGIVLSTLTARRATGYLPLTRASAKSIGLVRWSPIAPVGLMLVFWATAAAAWAIGPTGATPSAIVAYFGLFGSFFMVGAIVAFLLTHRFGPRGYVMAPRPGEYEHIVELSNVHAAFVSAVVELQERRAGAETTLANLVTSK